MKFEPQIEPFWIHHHEDNTSVTLSVGGYKDAIFAERADEGFEGSGYDWASLAAVFIAEKMPAIEADIRFDPEAGMFCAYSKNREAVEKFAVAFHAMCEDEAQMRELFTRAVLD
ncbi:immunity 51 family protein [Variovorax sp. 770b2]|uniref:immunity 51 family protein n=1 Tax=Variovorax sp. 770b2 TaxID=1566271 RepID=UPI0008F146BF|nr:immunity 51 family protein [Variovorax sp. 770b2]SFP52132.1 Immunity protein 51 [Variovorax sp. 770b2]